MVDFQGMYFNAKKALCINFQKRASIFHRSILSKINGGENGLWYVLPKSVGDTKNNYFPIEDRCSGLVFQYSLANILNLFQRFIKLLHQPMKPHGLIDQFPNRQKGNKESYYSIDDFLHRLKDYIGETIAKIYVWDITGMTTRDDDGDKVFLPYHTSKHQYCVQCYFERGCIVTKTFSHEKLYHISLILTNIIWFSLSQRINKIVFLSYTSFWRSWSNKFPKLVIKSKYWGVYDYC